MASPSLKCLMWSWQTVVFSCGPWGTPLMTWEHVPQIPSRQSLSKAIGSLPLLIRPSLTTSSISRKDMSGLTSLAWYSSSPPGLSGPFCLHTYSVKSIIYKTSNNHGELRENIRFKKQNLKIEYTEKKLCALH